MKVCFFVVGVFFFLMMMSVGGNYGRNEEGREAKGSLKSRMS